MWLHENRRRGFQEKGDSQPHENHSWSGKMREWCLLSSTVWLSLISSQEKAVEWVGHKVKLQ